MGQASALPRWQDIEAIFGDALPEDHLKLLKEMVQDGASANFIDIAKGKGRRATKP